MFAEHALDCSGDGELLCTDDEVLAGRFERRPRDFLMFGHDSFPFPVVALLLLYFWDFGAR